jgi:HEAT repeat protein
MKPLPHEDQPDTIDVGPVKGIPIHYDDDPRLEGDRQAWSAARRKAQAMQTTEALLEGLDDGDWRVRHEVVDRLVVWGRNDVRTLAALMRVAIGDAAWQVRDAAVMTLSEFDPELVAPTLRAATHDPQPDVRQSATFALGQIGANE